MTGGMSSKRLSGWERSVKERYCFNFSGLFLSVEDCYAHLWQADTLGILPGIIIAVQPYCGLAERIGRESKLRGSRWSCSHVGSSDGTDTRVRDPPAGLIQTSPGEDLPHQGVLNRNQGGKQMSLCLRFTKLENENNL